MEIQPVRSVFKPHRNTPLRRCRLKKIYGKLYDTLCVEEIVQWKKKPPSATYVKSRHHMTDRVDHSYGISNAVQTILLPPVQQELKWKEAPPRPTSHCRKGKYDVGKLLASEEVVKWKQTPPRATYSRLKCSTKIRKYGRSSFSNAIQIPCPEIRVKLEKTLPLSCYNQSNSRNEVMLGQSSSGMTAVTNGKDVTNSLEMVGGAKILQPHEIKKEPLSELEEQSHVGIDDVRDQDGSATCSSRGDDDKYCLKASTTIASHLPVSECDQERVATTSQQSQLRHWRRLMKQFSSSRPLPVPPQPPQPPQNNPPDTLCAGQTISDVLQQCQKISESHKYAFKHLLQNHEARNREELLIQNVLVNCKRSWDVWQCLALLHQHTLNGILCAGDALRNIRQTISFLSYLRSLKNYGLNLIIAESSKLDNWLMELESHTTWNILHYHGSQEVLQELQTRIFTDGLQEIDVVVTTYNVVTSIDGSILLRRVYHTLVFDDDSCLRNLLSQEYQTLLEIQAKRRLILQGVSHTETLLELASLLAFVMPDVCLGKLNYLKRFFSQQSEELSHISEEETVNRVKKILEPFVMHSPDNEDDNGDTDISREASILRNFRGGKKLPKKKKKKAALELSDKAISLDTVQLPSRLLLKQLKSQYTETKMIKLMTPPTVVMKDNLEVQAHIPRQTKRSAVKRPWCKCCKKYFSSKYALKDHMNLHTGAKPYICRFCGKAFSVRATAYLHERMHTGDTSLLSDYCHNMYLQSVLVQDYHSTLTEENLE